MTLSVIVVAAGSGERLGSASPKAFVSLAGATLLEHCLRPIPQLSGSREVVVVAPEGWTTPAEKLATATLGPDIPLTVVPGGATRTDSVRSGLSALSPQSSQVLIHDAARALTPVDVFDRVIAALDSGAVGVIPVVPVVDTIVPVNQADGSTGAAHPRGELGAVQTPQGFSTSSLLAAYDAFSGEATDDAEVMRDSGHEVIAVAGDRGSLKVTYPDDLRALEATLSSDSGLMIGTGVDVHRFDENSPLVLGGAEFPGQPGFAGHSDGDVIVHAITDALLAAASIGDLGTHFGVDRPEYDGVASTKLLSSALELLHANGYTPQSVSVQYIGNHPKIGPVREDMNAALTQLVGAPVHVAGTTTDGLGLTGRGEGAAAIATALVVRRGGAHARS